MTHLTESEIVDAVEARLHPARARHLDECGACRSRVGEAQETLQMAAVVDVPEPSPLFWDSFSTRVREAVAADDSRKEAWWARVAGWPKFSMAATAGTICLAVGLWTWQARGPADIAPAGSVPAPAPSRNTAMADAPDVADDLDTDEAWAIVRTVADDVDWEDAHAAGISASPGAADSAALDLSDAELSELSNILEDELKRANGA